MDPNWNSGGIRHCRRKQRRRLLIRPELEKLFFCLQCFSFLLIELEDEKLFFFISQHFFFKPKLKSVSYFAITVSLFSARVFLGSPHNLSQKKDKTLRVVGLFVFFRQIVLLEIIRQFITSRSYFEEEGGHLLLKLTRSGRLAGRPVAFAVCIF